MFLWDISNIESYSRNRITLVRVMIVAKKAQSTTPIEQKQVMTQSFTVPFMRWFLGHRELEILYIQNVIIIASCRYLTHWGPEETTLHHENRSALDQVMYGCLFGAKPPSKTKLAYCKSYLVEQILSQLETSIQWFVFKRMSVCKKKWLLLFFAGLNIIWVRYHSTM